jgi:hypothetical protein
VAQSGSKVSNDALVDDDPDLLNFAMMVSWVIGWMSFLLQKYWPDPGKSNGPVFATPDAGSVISVLSHDDVEGGFRKMPQLASLIHLSSTNFMILGLIILSCLSSPMMTSLPLVDSA